MRDCPRCGAVIDGEWCHACGEGKPAELGKSVRDPLWWVCVHIERGLRCGNPGAFRESTLGGDHWFCKQHYPPFKARHFGPRTAPDGGFDGLRDRAAEVADKIKRERERYGPKLLDAEGVAERLAIQSEP